MILTAVTACMLCYIPSNMNDDIDLYLAYINTNVNAFKFMLVALRMDGKICEDGMKQDGLLIKYLLHCPENSYMVCTFFP